MKTFTLTQEQLQKVVTYLGTKPANETLALLNELLSIKPNVDPAPPTSGDNNGQPKG